MGGLLGLEFHLPPSITNYHRGVLDLSKCVIQCWLSSFLEHFYQNKAQFVVSANLNGTSSGTLK